MPAQDDGRILNAAAPTVPPAVPLTEAANLASRGIDGKSSLEILETIHAEDLKACQAIGGALAGIARVVDEVVRAFREGGRLIYLGAGTSGRLGVLDASECLPTFGVGPEGVVGVIAGGDRALREPVEGAEDSPQDGAEAVRALNVRPADVVCGIAASGATPYVWGAIEEASRRGAFTVLLTCNPQWPRHARAGLTVHAVVIPVGPEIIAGSTRMKAGTATKLVLNSISTAAMIRSGKVHDNLMVDLKPLNEKLRRRARGLVERIAEVTPERAAELLLAAQGDVKAAIVIARRGLGPGEARELLRRNGGVLRRALEG